jgi:hypothetical protein
VIDDMTDKLAHQFVPMIAADRIFVTERNSGSGGKVGDEF